MLLADELALVAIDPVTGRRFSGTGGFDAVLAGLLIAELQIAGRATYSGKQAMFGPVTLPGSEASVAAIESLPHPVLRVADRILAQKGPTLRPVISAMSRGLKSELGTSTSKAIEANLVASGKISPSTGWLRPKVSVLDPAGREEIVARVRRAAHSDGPVDDRTAALLDGIYSTGLTGRLLVDSRRDVAIVANRVHALLGSSPLGTIGVIVRDLIKPTGDSD